METLTTPAPDIDNLQDDLELAGHALGWYEDATEEEEPQRIVDICEDYDLMLSAFKMLILRGVASESKSPKRSR